MASDREPTSPRVLSRADEYRRRTLAPVRSQKFCTTPSLVSLLEDPAVLDSFGDHLDASLQSENLDFWLEAAVFRTLQPTGPQARALAVRIWNRYLSPSAPEQVNVPGHLIEQVEAGLRQPDLSGLFEACFDHVQTLLESECIPRFVKRNLALRVLTGRLGARTSARKAPVLMWLEARLVATHGLDSRGLPLPPFAPIQWLAGQTDTPLSSLQTAEKSENSPPSPSFTLSSSSSSPSSSPPPLAPSSPGASSSSSVPAGLPADFLSGPAGLPFGDDDEPSPPPAQGHAISTPPSTKKSTGIRLGKSKERTKVSKPPKDKPRKVKPAKSKGAHPEPSAPIVFSNPRRVFASTSFRGQACFSNHGPGELTMPNYLQGVERLLAQTSLLSDKLEARASAMLEACLDEELELTPDVHSFKYALAALRSVANPILAEILVRSYLLNHCSCLPRSDLLKQPVATLLGHPHAESTTWSIGLNELVDTWRGCYVSGATMATAEQERTDSPPTRTTPAQTSSSNDAPSRPRLLPTPTALIDSSVIGLRRAVTLVPNEPQRDLLIRLLQVSEAN